MSRARSRRLLDLLILGQFFCAAVPSVLVFGADDPRSGAMGKVLTICAIPDSMPRMGKTAEGKPIGLDVAVAEHVARILGRPIEFHWCAGAECAWNCLPAGRCDLVIGQPQESSPSREVAWSVPYALAQFGLIVPRAVPSIRLARGLSGQTRGNRRRYRRNLGKRPHRREVQVA